MNQPRKNKLGLLIRGALFATPLCILFEMAARLHTPGFWIATALVQAANPLSDVRLWFLLAFGFDFALSLLVVWGVYALVTVLRQKVARE